MPVTLPFMTMEKENKILGLIAGGGQFPVLVAEAARAQGCHVVAVAHLGETDPSLSEQTDEISWIKLGQFGHLIKALKKSGVRQALMAGSINKKRMFEMRPDFRGLTLISKMAIFHDDGILTTVADEMAKEGIEIIPSTAYLKNLLASEGFLTRKRPSRSELEDIDFGWRIAKELGRLDIGQSVVVRRRTILAVEAMEGTDKTIERGGGIAREKAVVVKVSKPHQDLRFDVPSVGLGTVRKMAEVRASVLAIEAQKTLIFDKPDMIALADRAGIAVVSKRTEELRGS